MSARGSAPPSDPPITQPDADRLGRGEVAAHLYRLLTTAPAEWPVRVALLGAWGEGKTSVANLVEALATQQKHVVVTYPVSSIASVDELWLGFGQALCRAIDTVQLLQPHELPFRRLEVATGLRRRPWLGPVAANAAGAAVALKFPTWAATARSTAAGLFSWLARNAGIGPTAVTKIRSKLGPDRRVIVILDDLDRADPRVVPELLLRLRDLLELPQFSFLVPFDRGVVARTLTEHHKAWENPDRFLEKIFDYQIDLPEPSPSARLRMIEGEIEEHCPFVPHEHLRSLRNVLPTSPRKLKSLVRHLYLYRDEAARHDEGEIDWWTVVCFELLRQVSPRHRDVVIEALERWPEHEREGSSAPSLGEMLAEEMSHGSLRTLILQKFAEGEPKIGASKDARTIVAAWLDRLPMGRDRTAVGYIRLLATSSLVSAGEFREQLAKWREGRRLDPVAAWINQQAAVKAASSADLAAALIRHALEQRGALLEFMHQRRFKNELAAPAGEATMILDLVAELLPEISYETGLRDDLDRAVIEQVARRFHFDRNDADRRLRDHEIMVLESLVEKAHGRAERFLGLLGATWPSPDARQRWRALQERLSVRTRPLLTQHLQYRFQEDEVQQLVAADAPLVVKQLALGDDTPLWRRDDTLSLWPLLEQEEVSPQVAGNALDLLGTCVALLAYLDGSQELTRAFLAREERVAALWKAAMSHEWQFSHLHHCRELRRRLIAANGKLEPVLPEPSWLRKDEDEADGVSRS